MATQIKTIKQKITSISNIKKITKTMEMVSIAKMKKAVDLSLRSKEYAKYALEILKTLANEREIEHPLLELGKGDTTLLVIFASNKGLCGSYNMNISKLVHQYKMKHGEKIEAVTIGKQAEKIAHRNKFKIIASFHDFGEDISIEEVVSLRKFLMKQFLETGKYKRVVAIYTEFVKRLNYQPIARKILPVTVKATQNLLSDSASALVEKNGGTMPLYIFEPSEARVLEKVIPTLLNDVLLQIMLESLASEHSSRMVAMKNATDNATELVSDLLLTFNRARQANITQEVAEIIAGAEALNKN